MIPLFNMNILITAKCSITHFSPSDRRFKMTRFRAHQQLVRARFEIGVTLGFSLTTSVLHGLENSTIVHFEAYYSSFSTDIDSTFYYCAEISYMRWADRGTRPLQIWLKFSTRVYWTKMENFGNFRTPRPPSSPLEGYFNNLATQKYIIDVFFPAEHEPGVGLSLFVQEKTGNKKKQKIEKPL